MKKILLLTAAFVFASIISNAQGCIPVRNISGFGQFNLTDKAFSISKWQLDLTNRYFRSFRDFKDKTDLKTPTQNQSVNEVYTFDILLTRMFAKGWSVNINIIYFSRYKRRGHACT